MFDGNNLGSDLGAGVVEDAALTGFLLNGYFVLRFIIAYSGPLQFFEVNSLP
jgi:hypothetical protein